MNNVLVAVYGENSAEGADAEDEPDASPMSMDEG